MWGLLAFLVGIAYGYFTPGKTDKSKLFLRGLLWGAVIAVVLVIIGALTGFNPLGVANDPIGWFIAFAIITVLFILGVWLGDWLEHRRRPAGGVTRRTM